MDFDARIGFFLKEVGVEWIYIFKAGFTFSPLEFCCRDLVSAIPEPV